MKQNTFYVAIENPETLRKDLLSSSKNVLSTLKRYEEYRQTREQKIKLTGELKDVFNELIELQKRIANIVPDLGLTTTTEKKEFQRQRKETIPKRIEQVFEDKLAEIERKLGELS